MDHDAHCDLPSVLRILAAKFLTAGSTCAPASQTGKVDLADGVGIIRASQHEANHRFRLADLLRRSLAPDLFFALKAM